MSNEQYEALRKLDPRATQADLQLLQELCHSLRGVDRFDRRTLLAALVHHREQAEKTMRAQIARMEQTARDDQAHRDYMTGVVGHGAG